MKLAVMYGDGYGVIFVGGVGIQKVTAFKKKRLEHPRKSVRRRSH